jgi:competence protein ComEC
VLLVSGLDAVGEAHVLQMHEAIGADTLVVARSGHAEATSDAWLDALNPARAVISVGLNDRHRRPDPAVVERLAKRGVDLYQTSHCGAVAITWTRDADAPRIDTAVGQRRRFWHSARNC